MIVKIFERFAEVEAKHSSPLYAFWSNAIVADDALLDLISTIPQSQPKPNLFFASIQWIAYQNNHPLVQVLKSPEIANFKESFQLLKQVCSEYEEALIQLFHTRLVQTNEVNRASYLYPLFDEIYQSVKKPLTLIEIGTSAGILLDVDQFNYEIMERNNTKIFGDAASDITIRAVNNGQPLNISNDLVIYNRIGIDLNIIQLEQEDDYHWMQSLIWPEHKERKVLLEKIRDVNINCSKTLVEGDFLEIIPNYLEMRNEDSQIVIFHTHVANQFSTELKESLLTMICKLSYHVPLYHVYNNMDDANLHVDLIQRGTTINLKEMKNTDGHGKYFSWI